MLPVYVTRENLVNGTLKGKRVFQIANIGESSIKFTHIGIENMENTCEFSGFSITTQDEQAESGTLQSSLEK